jgi:hypothetical protein
VKGEIVTVGATATLIASGAKGSVGSPVRVLVRLPTGGSDVALGGSGVVFAEGYLWEDGDGPIGADLVAGEDLYGITAAGTQTVYVLRNGS